MKNNDALIRQIEDFCSRSGMEPSTFGRKAVNDGKLFNRLKAGGSITLRTYQYILDFMKPPRVREQKTTGAAL